jgi:hypothetical protein
MVKTGEMTGLDPDSVVMDSYLYVVPLPNTSDFHAVVGTAVLDGVVQEIDHWGTEPLCILSMDCSRYRFRTIRWTRCP